MSGETLTVTSLDGDVSGESKSGSDSGGDEGDAAAGQGGTRGVELEASNRGGCEARDQEADD